MRADVARASMQNNGAPRRRRRVFAVDRRAQTWRSRNDVKRKDAGGVRSAFDAASIRYADVVAYARSAFEASRRARSINSSRHKRNRQTARQMMRLFASTRVARRNDKEAMCGKQDDAPQAKRAVPADAATSVGR